jgi:hypothetical protein
VLNDKQLIIDMPFREGEEKELGKASYVITRLQSSPTMAFPSFIALADARTESDACKIQSYQFIVRPEKGAKDIASFFGILVTKSKDVAPDRVSVNIGGFTNSYLLKDGKFKDSNVTINFRVNRITAGDSDEDRRIGFRITIQDSLLSLFKKLSPVDGNGLPTSIPITVFFDGINFTTSQKVTFEPSGNVFAARPK